MKAHQYRHQNRRSHLPAYCVCAHCGAAIRHVPGIPCSSRTCPVCSHATYKSYEEIAAEKIIALDEEAAEDFEVATPKRTTKYPVVHPEKCTACGSCMDVCPANCIQYVNEKAFVIEADCRNCRICVKACPENAFEIR
ncbi:MAG: 4Fe-4S binding protein [Bacteroidetes bacterium]|nr:4Fe-4S binding protein [Bacteroidota bacterium]MBU1578168.1 4Fe-4S binding protein [Bacteroidota bacterium]